jgi:tryptophanyl-tRNA synthetase
MEVASSLTMETFPMNTLHDIAAVAANHLASCEAMDGLPSARVVTGDRPTGALHLGHLVGSLSLRVALQEHCPQTVLVADLQALTDNGRDPGRISGSVREVLLDYMAVGLDPSRTVFALQSSIPELAEIFVLMANVVSVGRCERNPTLREESKARGFERSTPLGFLSYPVSQAADIVGLGGVLIPVGEDQLPMIELANEVVDMLGSVAGRDVVRKCRPLLTSTPRLPGSDGRKASKSAGNCLRLSASRSDISAFVRAMFTDPGHLRVSDPGKVEDNVVFAHLDAFDADVDCVTDLKRRYRAGGLGDSVVKSRLVDVLDSVLAPIRDRRAEIDPDMAMDALSDGTATARMHAGMVLSVIRSVFGLSPVKDA